MSCSVVLGLFCVVRLLFDFVLWLFRDGFVFFDPGCPVSTPPFPFLILRSGILGIFPSFFLPRAVLFSFALSSFRRILPYISSRALLFSKKNVRFHLDSSV